MIINGVAHHDLVCESDDGSGEQLLATVLGLSQKGRQVTLTRCNNKAGKHFENARYLLSVGVSRKFGFTKVIID